MVRLAGALAVLLLAAVAAVAFVALRPDSRATLDDPPRAVVECAAASGLDEATCRAWGLAMVAAGAPSNTFELTDLGRLHLDRGLFGLASTCRTDWFTTRYPTEAAWTEEIPCPAS